MDEEVRGFVYMNPGGFITEYIGGDAEHYILRADSLIFRGYTRGRNIGALVDSTALAMHCPPMPGDSVVTRYSLSGSIDGMPVFRDRGNLKSEVTDPGRFIFAPGDTVEAYLVHEQRTYITAFGDSVSSTNTDEFWRWYLQGERLPFALQLRHGDDMAPRLFLSDRFPANRENASRVQKEEDARQKILDSAQVMISDREATVILGRMPGAEAEVYVFDAAGNLYGHTVRRLDEPANEFHIDLPGIQRQGCMLVITIGGNPPLTGKYLLQ